ncbi:glycosyltransferase family 2 protein [Uliginosibacterium sp. 31-12]|uniref:glycosyltransferase family 2 protein n=1 Tax=Uliginosibacterium sp. 31-12 TaxID=3062781 RepID=UPI0026E3F255|nr:glycosyltransferase family 2 protein [Uliginosibacterium sp. 31-12]MDO6386073.1 glycosyltransferase family 2 protein [Uliginosibacterium sp. 31-12]
MNEARRSHTLQTQLSVSLVTYHPDEPMLRDTLASLRVAVAHARAAGVIDGVRLVLVDNGDDVGLDELARASGWEDFSILSGHGNVGFGQGHNLALAGGTGDLHLILNPDVYLQPDALSAACLFMAEETGCVLLSPAILGAESGWHFLCKRYPSVFDLVLRGFFPHLGRRFFAQRLAHYEMLDTSSQSVLWDPPIVSGCFMLLRAPVLQTLGGFDPGYFLYFEDFDLSLRAARHGRVAAVSDVRIAHFGGGAGQKGWRHVRMFCRSGLRFFNRHGWRIA